MIRSGGGIGCFGDAVPGQIRRRLHLDQTKWEAPHLGVGRHSCSNDWAAEAARPRRSMEEARGHLRGSQRAEVLERPAWVLADQDGLPTLVIARRRSTADFGESEDHLPLTI